MLAGRRDFGGLVAIGNQLFDQDTPGVPGGNDSWDRFGNSLAGGDFDRSGHADLAVGAPHEDVSGVSDAGAEWVLYGSLFADGVESGSTGRWSSVVP